MAGQIPQHFIDELLSRIDIVDVINLRVSLKKAGSNYKACCPFHNEKTPSFTVSQPKQFYHCFGCGANGSAIGFLMEYENMHFVDAVETLAESLGLDVPREGGAQAPQSNSKPLYELLESVSNFYQKRLRDTPEAIEYLKARGLTGETCKAFGIGYAPDGWDALTRAFPDQEAALVKTGMLKYSDDATAGSRGAARAYQRFRARVMFPIRDRRGRVIAFGGRVLGDDEPKYLNSPETPLFNKASELYGLFEARKAAQEAGSVIVVEGYMDVVALAEQGVRNAVATLGTAANQQHSEALFRVVPNVVFCFDGDRAGRAAAWRALSATLPCLADGRDAHFLFLPDGEDPDSIVRSRGAAGFAELLDERVPIIEFLYRHLAEGIDMKSMGGKATLSEKAKPLVAKIPRGIYRQLAMRQLEKLVGLSLGSERAGQPPAPNRSLPVHEDTGLTPMRRAVLLVMQQPASVSSLPVEAYDYDQNLPGANVLTRLIGYCDGDESMTTARLLERFRDKPEHGFLTKLAGKSYWPDGRELDLDTAVVELAHCIEILCKQSRNTTDVSQIPKALRFGGLLGIRGGQAGPRKFRP